MLLSSLLSLLLLPLFYLQLNFYFSSALIFHRHRSASPVRALEGRSASSGFYVATAAPCELLSVSVQAYVDPTACYIHLHPLCDGDDDDVSLNFHLLLLRRSYYLLPHHLDTSYTVDTANSFALEACICCSDDNCGSSQSVAAVVIYNFLYRHLVTERYHHRCCVLPP